MPKDIDCNEYPFNSQYCAKSDAYCQKDDCSNCGFKDVDVQETLDRIHKKVFEQTAEESDLCIQYKAKKALNNLYDHIVNLQDEKEKRDLSTALFNLLEFRFDLLDTDYRLVSDKLSKI